MNDLLKTILNGLKTSFDSELKRVKKAVSEALNTANTAASSVGGKMNAKDPVGSGSFSMNRLEDSTVGDSSHAEGTQCTASGDYSHAEGWLCNAEGRISHAEGTQCTASGDSSHAEGTQCTASGDRSHAEGWLCNAEGRISHAEGEGTVASGEASHAEGHNTIAQCYCQHVQGRFNIKDENRKYAHIIGNGRFSNGEEERSNAHTIDWNGLGWFAGGLKVGGTGQDDETAEEVALKTDIPEIPSLEPYALKTEIPSLDNYALKTEIPSLDDYALKTDLENVKPTAAQVNPLTKALFNDYTLLYRYARTGSLGEKEEFNDAALSESIQNFTMLYVLVTSNQFILGSTYIPVSMFGITLPDVTDKSFFELNFVNDQQNLFGGNVRYASDTTISGKIVGNTKALLVYGIGRVAN